MCHKFCTRRQFLRTGVAAIGAAGIPQICFTHNIFAAQQPVLNVNITARCIFNSVVVTNEDQKSFPNPYKKETDYDFMMNDNCSGVNQGIEAVRSGSADVGTLLRHISAEEKAAGLIETELDRIAYAVIVNKKNPVKELTMEQALNIFAGRIQNWREVGGKNMDIVIYKQECGANYDYVIDRALAKAGIKKNLGRLEEAVMNVKITDNQLEKIAIYDMSITIVPRIFFDGNSRQLKIAGVLPTRISEKNGSYPFLANISLVTRKNSSNPAKKFLSFMTGHHGRDLIEKGLAMDWLKNGF